MELVGMLPHLASWQVLALVAMLDLTLILMHLTSPSPLPLLPSTHPRSDPHLLLLDRISREKERVGREVGERVREVRNLTRGLKLRGEEVRRLSDSIQRLETSILRLQEARPRAAREEEG
ncbi:uncharacterized protein LOC143282990 [Babylonia areolata]|uniref:uncharacterized protein LOC143282990 n=1 Tax=Babylonia areolata TaxID=304850 RepID=UPI003FD63068